jgi:hypothetical protein
MLGSMMVPLKKPAGCGHREMAKQNAQEAQAEGKDFFLFSIL